MNLRPILSPVDFSEHSSDALRRAEALARYHGRRLTIVTVIQQLSQTQHAFNPVRTYPRGDGSAATVRRRNCAERDGPFDASGAAKWLRFEAKRSFKMKGRHASSAPEGTECVWCLDRRAAGDDSAEAVCRPRTAEIAAGADRAELCAGSDYLGRCVLAPSACRRCGPQRACG